jgi:hypothetical protein
MSFRVDDEVLKLSGSELTRSSRIRFMRWVIACLAKAIKRDHSDDPSLVFLY